jgi:hypothetical protein
MAMKPKMRWAVGAASLALTIACSSARADDVPLVTGEHWTQSSEQLKRVYLIGIANAFQVEAGFQGANPSADTQSVVPRFARGLKGQTLDSVREGLDSWYAGHPDQLQRPVIETIWFQVVVPGLQKNK